MSRQSTIWHGCYGGSWNGIITPDAFAHPAKFAPGLIQRIYSHMLERGYLAAGDSVVDPFGGVGLGGYHAMLNDLHFTGVELEPRFVALGNANIDKWQHDLRMLNGRLGTARLLQGDSRQLAAVVGGGMAAAVGSPPYSGADGEGRTTERDNRRLIEMGREDLVKRLATEYRGGKQYGTATPGQLGTMPNGSFDSAVSSPPYADAVNGSGEGPGARHDYTHHKPDTAERLSSDNGYGQTPGNLGNLAGVGFDAAVGSPPYEASVNDPRVGGGIDKTKFANPDKHIPRGEAKAAMTVEPFSYGSTPSNIGNDTGETFWAAARVIVEQTYAVLKPGGYVAWVTKRFVRKGQIVEFSEQWAQLCEAVGFERVEWVRAMLVEDHGDQMDIFGGVTPRGKQRKSFFRRLAEKKGSPRIDWEDVIILRKPL